MHLLQLGQEVVQVHLHQSGNGNDPPYEAELLLGDRPEQGVRDTELADGRRSGVTPSTNLPPECPQLEWPPPSLRLRRIGPSGLRVHPSRRLSPAEGHRRRFHSFSCVRGLWGASSRQLGRQHRVCSRNVGNFR